MFAEHYIVRYYTNTRTCRSYGRRLNETCVRISSQDLNCENVYIIIWRKSEGLAIHFPCSEQSFWALCITQQCGSLCRNVWLSFCVIVLPNAFRLYDSQNRLCNHLKLYSRTVFLKQLFLMFAGLVSSESAAEPITFYKGGKNDQFAEEFDRSWFSHCSGGYFLLLLLNGGTLKLLVKCDKILS